jgi:preprotein translocase subunit SecY
VRKIGASIYNPLDLEEMSKTFRFDLIQAPFNLVDRRLQKTGWLKKLKDKGVEIHTRSAFLQGLLLMSPKKDFTRSSCSLRATSVLRSGVLVLAIVVAGVVLITQGQRKIPVQYAQRAVGRKIMSGGTSFMPLRVNYAGVMPVIFAQAILMFPGMIIEKLAAILPAGFAKQVSIYIASHLGRQGFTYLFLYGLMILFFSYFWVATQFNELQVADDLKKHGGYIPGVRPGTATSDFLHNTMSRITLAGAVFLVVIAIIPTVMSAYLKIDPLVAQFFGGTSLLITVGVLLDTMRQMESYLLMRHYDGFLKKGKVRGRA